jgi:hypothetical protein
MSAGQTEFAAGPVVSVAHRDGLGDGGDRALGCAVSGRHAVGGAGDGGDRGDDDDRPAARAANRVLDLDRRIVDHHIQLPEAPRCAGEQRLDLVFAETSVWR